MEWLGIKEFVLARSEKTFRLGMVVVGFGLTVILEMEEVGFVPPGIA
jgi:hypothetical protein